jgi:glycosyltransferase involved in cell wall biosynthesis
VKLVTLRNPVPPRYLKMLNTLQKVFQTGLVAGTVVPTHHLSMNFGTVFSYVNLFPKVLLNRTPTMIDINALPSARLSIRKNTVVDFRTPLSYELSWLGHDFLACFARSVEACLKDVLLVTVVSDPMAKYCIKLGARNVLVVPNYPLRSFRSSVQPNAWKTMHGLNENEHVILFSGGVRLREIYGLDLLLESWKRIEKCCSSSTLVILGDDSIASIKDLSRSLKISKVVLPGRVNMSEVANWINCADVCVAPRTPGFSSSLYNGQDSNKIAEYAAFAKRVVATSYAPSKQYLLVDPDPESFADGIMKGLERKIAPAKPHFWEENEKRLLQSLQHFWFG